MDHQVVSDYSGNDENTSSAIKVFVRARPAEGDTNNGLDHFTLFPPQNKKIKISDPNTGPNHNKYGDHVFSYNSVFWADIQQKELYESTCSPHVEHVMNGYNSCCFAYGQTGSGKTYTMFGEENDQRGLIPRCVEDIFKSMKHKQSAGSDCKMVVSFLEVYCDQIRDLGKAYLIHMNGNGKDELSSSKTSEIFERMQLERQSSFSRPRTLTRTESGEDFGSNSAGGHFGNHSDAANTDYQSINYEIHEDIDKNVYVKELAVIPVTTEVEVMKVINQGLKLRATHETKINDVSSRSHTVFTINVVQRDRHTGESIKGMLNLVDLAGSERIKKSESSGIRLKEALHINTSLTAIGKVVLALDPSQGITHVPYSDSKLTRLLQNSLGGNCYTTLVATIHPVAKYSDESLSTLQFANRCRNVQNNPAVNKQAAGKNGGGVGGGAGGGIAGPEGKKMADEIQILKKKLAASESNTKLGADPNIRVIEVLKQL